LHQGAELAIVADMCSGDDGRFPVRMRLKRRADFDCVFRQGKLWRGEYFHFRVIKRAQEARMGISVSRRFGNAVERNRVKRLIRDVFRRHKASFFGAEFIVCPRKECKGRHLAEIERFLLEEFSAAISAEVKHGKRDSLPDKRRTCLNAGGTGQGEEDPLRRDT